MWTMFHLFHLSLIPFFDLKRLCPINPNDVFWFLGSFFLKEKKKLSELNKFATRL